jgi:hypothetical protein
MYKTKSNRQSAFRLLCGWTAFEKLVFHSSSRHELLTTASPIIFYDSSAKSVTIDESTVKRS